MFILIYFPPPLPKELEQLKTEEEELQRSAFILSIRKHAKLHASKWLTTFRKWQDWGHEYWLRVTQDFYSTLTLTLEAILVDSIFYALLFSGH